jgi:hypothetical protein
MNHTIESMLAQCEEVGECLEWQGRMQNGSPQVFMGKKEDGQSRYRTARRVFTELLNGSPLPALQRCIATCGNARCMRHIGVRTHKQIAAIAVKAGAQSTPGFRAAMVRGRRNRPDVKLSIEKAREIRASGLSGPALAAIYGVNRTAIAAVRRGDMWREALPGASVFSL